MGECVTALDYTFSALAHPTRRGMLELLAREPVRVTDLAAQFDCSLNVASKHILNLERAGLVRREQKGREHWLRLDATPLSDASAFVQRYRKLWERQLDRLGAYLDTMASQQSGAVSANPKSQKSAS
ncbi:ArsR/SmtB family transcription factor [Verrucomicrobium spinosum]|uniref:ArsR/SmtB family transcription factor n=1 Tax=Verrucomicrobium spinosum TaxID=2736 RepID=UPI000174440A|nr:metalloregulator ArsR/SmtB family transcription factor [Verrucomicrobium spinosum]